jgi:hypothetical protein
MASDAFQVYKNSTGAVVDEKTGLLSISPAQFSKLHGLTIFISDVCI